MKTCNKCKKDKDESEFYRNRTRDDGLEYYCKICAKESSSKYYNKNKRTINAKKRAYDNISQAKARTEAKRRNFIAKYGKDINDIIYGDHEERHELSEFLDVQRR